MNKITKKINFVIAIVCMVAILCINGKVYATDDGLDWWNKATDWYSEGSTEVGISNNMLSGIATLVEVVGTAVIAIATVVLGIKYMFGTVQAKTQAKEGMINLLVACLFFFGWSNIRSLLITGSGDYSKGISGEDTQLVFFQGGDYNTAFSQIFTFLLVIAKFIAVFAILYVGVRYIFSGAQAKAELKEKSISLIIGIILIFCSLNVISFIADIVSGSQGIWR